MSWQIAVVPQLKWHVNWSPLPLYYIIAWNKRECTSVGILFQLRKDVWPWCGRLPVEPAGLPPRHPGAPTLWLSEVPPSGSPLPFLGGGRGCPCGGSPGGPVPWGASGCLGPGSFPCLLHALRDGAVVPQHTIKRLHGGTLWTQARSHTQVYTQAFTLV